MGAEVLAYDERHLRGTDGNSLLRMYDLATRLLSRASSQQERARADKAIKRIARELQKRNIVL
jgi:hypothetical protein